jgi:hypothetical protein
MQTPYAGEAGILLHIFGKFMILKCQTSRFNYGSKVPDVTITVFITILEQNMVKDATPIT